MRTKLKWIEEFIVSQPQAGETFTFDGSAWRNTAPSAAFDLREIKTSQAFEVESGQQGQSIGFGLIIDGELRIEGSYLLDDFANPLDFPEANYSQRRIEGIVKIPTGQQMLVISTGLLDVDGELCVDGELILDQIQDAPPAPPLPLPIDQFAYRTIPEGRSVSIAQNQQMLIDGMVFVDGSLIIEGELCVFADDADDGLTPYWIATHQRFSVPPRKEMFLSEGLFLDGHLEIEGRFQIGA